MSEIPDDIIETARGMASAPIADDAGNSLRYFLGQYEEMGVTVLAKAILSERQRHAEVMEEVRKKARRKALEEVAAYHDDQAAQHDAVDYESDFHVQMVRRHRNYAAAIRALSVSSPTSLQEQNANSGKEGE